ncbi:DUF2158 domain-containing protein [Magnetospirillum sp. 64-120]|uniref:YodC family protein n=1 Tax=Magnetospirillum sp. 64-120 TaxID=1895778 RepID=UPI0009288AE4|nr:DUF2158 domain-containing protein [Magnetospirillum sp. 64-120]OJX65817.1 MAG: hypothetical protein BGO92_06900 [Magnetospirillum sp. 64-120]
MAFKVGDIVQLKSGGPEMTVVTVDQDGKGVWAAWFAGKKSERSHFPNEALNTPPATKDGA